MKKHILMVIAMALSAQAHAISISAEEMNSALDVIIKNNNARIEDQQRNQLLEEFKSLAQLSDEDRGVELAKTRIEKFATCRLADLVIIASGVGESLPVAAAGVREVNFRFIGNGLAQTASVFPVDPISLKNFFGGAADSVVGVSIETLSSWDLSKVEKQIQKAYPATQLMAVKVKGESSYCGHATLKFDMLEALQLKASQSR